MQQNDQLNVDEGGQKLILLAMQVVHRNALSSFTLSFVPVTPSKSSSSGMAIIPVLATSWHKEKVSGSTPAGIDEIMGAGMLRVIGFVC